MLQGIPPRGQYDNPIREKIAVINGKLSDVISTMPSAQFLNTDASLFVSDPDAAISHRDMYDYIHLTKRGYQKLLDPLLDEVQTIMKNFMTADSLSLGDSAQ